MLIYYLRGPILDSSDLVEVVLTFYITFTLEDIPFHLTSILCLQLPDDKILIRHFSLEDIVLSFRRTNAFECF